MAGSLFDQLKQSGLVDDKKARKAKQEKHQQNKKKRANKAKKGQAVVSETAQLAAKAAEEKAERNRQLNLERQQEQAKKESKAQVRQLIESNQISGYEGEVAYNFADGTSVKTLNVNEKTHRGLVNESIRIARYHSGYVLVLAEVAEKIAQRDAEVLIALITQDDSISKEDQDYYAQFEIPDDLVW